MQLCVWLSGGATNEMVSRDIQGWLEIASSWKHDKSVSASHQLTRLAELAEYLDNLNRELCQPVSLNLTVSK